jgi:hypothetical protein
MAHEHGSGQDREKKNYYQCGLHRIDENWLGLR